MTVQTLLAWWNLIFVVPFGLALVYLGVYTFTGVTIGDPDADVDADADADVHGDLHADHDVDADADADAEADGDADAHDYDHDHVGGGRLGLGLLAFIGVGRVPLSILLTVLLFTWGAVGFISNTVLQPRVDPAWTVALASVPCAALAGVMMTRAVSSLICRYMPLNGTSARRKHELLGLAGTALYPVNETFGLASVRDDEGNLFQVPCRVEAGRDTIGKGESVLLVGYSAKQQIYHVIPDGPGALTEVAAPPDREATKAR
jgi:hypothetical protein